MNNFCVYIVRNRLNNKCYIGQTNHIGNRWRAHRRNDSNSVIGQAIQKYGVSAFDFTILVKDLSLTQANTLERFLIATYKTVSPHGYNVRDGGNNFNPMAGLSDEQKANWRRNRSNAMKGKKLSDEHKQKISESLKGHKHSLESRQKMSNAQKKKWENPKTRQKLREAAKGRKHSEETRRKMSEIQKGKKLSPESIAKRTATRKHNRENHQLKLPL